MSLSRIPTGFPFDSVNDRAPRHVSDTARLPRAFFSRALASMGESESLADVLPLVLSRSDVAVRECWREAVPRACSNLQPADVADAAASLSSTVLQCVEIYSHSRTSDAMIYSVGIVARQGDAMGATFASALTKRILAATAGPKPALSSPMARLLGLRALCAATAGQFATLAGSKEAPADGFGELVLAQGALLHALREDSRRPALARAAHTAVCGLVRSVPEAAPRYASVLLALESPGAEAVALAGVLLDPRMRRDLQAMSSSDRAAWLALYSAAVLGAAQPPSAHASGAFKRLLGSATADEWSGSLLPAALRALKRTPDASVPTLAALLDALPRGISLDAAAAQIVDALVPLILGPSAPRAALAVGALGALARRCTSSAVLASAASLASTKGSSISSSGQRAAYASALAELAVAARRADAATSKEAGAVIDSLIALASKETQEAARVSLLASSGRWLPLVATPAPWATAMQKALADKSAELRRAHVHAILAALQPPHNVEAGSSSAAAVVTPEPPVTATATASAALVSALTTLAEPLVGLIKPTLKKPPAGPSRADAIAALCCLREGAAVCPAVQQALVADKVWASVLKPKDSFLWQVEPIGGASERELWLLLRLLEGILLCSPKELALCGDGTPLL